MADKPKAEPFDAEALERVRQVRSIGLNVVIEGESVDRILATIDARDEQLAAPRLPIEQFAALLPTLAGPITWSVRAGAGAAYAWAHAHVGSYIPRTFAGKALPEHEFRFNLNVHRNISGDCSWEIGVPGLTFGGDKCASLEAGQEAAVGALLELLRRALAELVSLASAAQAIPRVPPLHGAEDTDG